MWKTRPLLSSACSARCRTACELARSRPAAGRSPTTNTRGEAPESTRKFGFVRRWLRYLAGLMPEINHTDGHIGAS